MTIISAKAQIEKLVEKYRQEKQAGKLSRYTEEETKKDFILPLFEALGWDVYNKNEVTAEEQISGDRVDYGFYFNGRTKFYLEAKPFKADLHREDFARQAIRYSWNKEVTWAILTDFEILIVFNALSPEKSLHGKKYFEIPCEEYIERFDQLWLLSKAAFLEDKLDREAEKVGKKVTKISIGATLSKDLNECRQLLTEAFFSWNKKIDPNLIDEGVQRLLDRLVFIRVAEDRKVEPPTLRPIMKDWMAGGRKGTLYQAMIQKFRELDKIYNSNLFAMHPFEKWEEYEDATQNVIEILYGKNSYVEYDFSVIPADVLGAVYENYLGYKLQQSAKKTVVGSDLELSKNLRKRKEQGIYYTPAFIVDYIAKNALGPVLDRCKSVNDLQKIRVLDPACGSGSFLIKAMELIAKKYEEFGMKKVSALTKMQILQNNLYGVDLDEQAVEIARLNLLLNTFDEQFKLPDLSHNIKNGNSLISGTDEELKKYFGKNFRDKKPFSWKEEFPEVFAQGGFDCIVGNPPWGANIDKDAIFLAAKYPNSTKAHKDTYKIFIDLALQKLRPDGYLGFVVPNTFLYQPRYQDIKDMLDNYKYLSVNLGEKIFGNVELPCSLLVVEKEKSDEHLLADLTKLEREKLPTEIWNIDSTSTRKTNKIATNILKDTGLTFDDVFLIKDAGVKHQRTHIGKGEKGKSDLRERIYYSGGLENAADHSLLTGSDINRYILHREPAFILRSNFKEILSAGEIVYFDENMMNSNVKILWRQTADTIRAMVLKKYWFTNTLQCAVLKDKYKNLDILYALAIFNSSYIDYLYRQKVLETGKVFPQVKLKYLRDLPFVIGRKAQQEKISTLAQKMIELNKGLRKYEEDSNEWQTIKDEIAKTDQKIDQEVYKLYGLTAQEIKIVEGK